jgi:vacuolar-type H+-ATPase subunit E/Vma4
MAKNKTDNFLKAIKKYAKEQKKSMQGEVKQLKTERLKEAEQRAKTDSERFIKEKLHEARNRRTSLLASKTQEGQKKLFVERSKMVDEVFELAAERLKAFAQTERYASELRKSAKSVAELFEGKDCVIYLNERDLGCADEIKSYFSANSKVQPDKSIKIGGVKGYCEILGIIADETLDSKLEAQREWFVENAPLSVL